MLSKAIAIAATAHQGQKDKGGKPYILHPLRVMSGLEKTGDEELMAIAIMHDVVEDTAITLDNLKDYGFSDRVIAALDCLTHRDKEDYQDYIARVETNRDAIQVKIWDLRDNSDLFRLKGVREKDFKRMEKYHRTYFHLKEVLEHFPS